jgi:hypothetical protein
MNSIGPKPAQVSPTWIGNGNAPARPRWRICTEDPVFLYNSKEHKTLFDAVADTLQKPPPSSISSQAEVHNGKQHGAKLQWGYAGRFMLRLVLNFGLNLIPTLTNVSPQPIWLMGL